MKNRRYQYLSFALLICLAVVSAKAQEAKYPPLSEYMMPQADEVALAKSAATVRAWKNRMVIAERIEELRSPNP